MMLLRAVQTVTANREAETNVGPVPIFDVAGTVTRAWFQCDRCALIGAIDGLASPMMPPPCANGCDDPFT